MTRIVGAVIQSYTRQYWIHTISLMYQDNTGSMVQVTDDAGDKKVKVKPTILPTIKQK